MATRSAAQSPFHRPVASTPRVGHVLLLILPVLLLGSFPAISGDLSGSVQAYTARTKRSDGRAEDVLNADYTLGYTVRMTPSLRFLLSYRGSEFESESEDGSEFDRSLQAPLIQLNYTIPSLSFRVAYEERRRRTSNDVENLDTTSLVAFAGWRPRKGPVLSLRVREESNVADVAVFGRDTDTTAIDFDAFYNQESFSIRYSFKDLSLTNNLDDIDFDQTRHQLRADWATTTWDGRLDLSAEAELGLVRQTQRAPSGTLIAEPIPRNEGLFTIDTTPAEGALDPNPELIDGDLETPVTPPIEIGGANTFRNVGVDLGFVRAVSELNLHVDSPSGPSLAWEVYASTDNLNWTLVPGALTSFDVALLRYVITFPEVESRFFKVVNVSANSQSFVFVTELRAFVDAPFDEETTRDSSTKRMAFTTIVRPHEDMSARFVLSYRDEESEAPFVPLRASEEYAYYTRYSWNLTRTLELNAGYDFSLFERQDEPVFETTERRYNAGLTWRPMPTVTASVRGGRREESERGALLRRSDNVEALALTQLYPDLDVSSSLRYSKVDDPFSGFTLTGLRWGQSVDGRPTRTWTVGIGYSIARFDSTGTVDLSTRADISFRSTWLILPGLTFDTSLAYGQEDDDDTLTQRYALSWTPGERLSVSTSYSAIDSVGGNETNTAGVSLRYRLTRRTYLFANWTRSETRTTPADWLETESARFGFTLAI